MNVSCVLCGENAILEECLIFRLLASIDLCIHVLLNYTNLYSYLVIWFFVFVYFTAKMECIGKQPMNCVRGWHVVWKQGEYRSTVNWVWHKTVSKYRYIPIGGDQWCCLCSKTALQNQICLIGYNIICFIHCHAGLFIINPTEQIMLFLPILFDWALVLFRNEFCRIYQIQWIMTKS